MTVHIHPIGEFVILAGLDMGKTERFMDYFVPRIPLRNIQVEDPAQRDPPRPKHHDHLIQRHIRSHQPRSRRS